MKRFYFAIFLHLSAYSLRAQTSPSFTYAIRSDQRALTVKFAGTNSPVSICLTDSFISTPCVVPPPGPPQNIKLIQQMPQNGKFTADLDLHPGSPHVLSVWQDDTLVSQEVYLPYVVPFSKICSTEVVNGDCTVVYDRKFPITMPTFQMRTGAHISVQVVNGLPFEMLTLDPQSQTAVAGTDQTSGLATALAPQLKSVVGVISVLGERIQNLDDVVTVQAFLSLENQAPPPADVTIRMNLDSLQNEIKAVFDHARDLNGAFKQIYLELQEISSPLPRPLDSQSNPVRQPWTSELPPSPWDNYAAWRIGTLNQLNVQGCAPAMSICGSQGVIAGAQQLKTEWTLRPSAVPAAPAGANCTATPNLCEYPAFTIAAQTQFDSDANGIQGSIDGLDNNDPAKQNFQNSLNRLKQHKAGIVSNLTTTATQISGEMDTITKDLNQYALNIELADGNGVHAVLGNIYDPVFSGNPTQSSARPRKSGVPAWKWGLMKFGRQTVFSINAVNLVDTSVALVPTTQKKSIATITAVYADPIFEVSAGTFFSWLPDRTFANQTQVLQQPGCPDVTATVPPITTIPTACDVTITETHRLPTVVPFAAANWRLGHDFPWWDGRRGAIYFTTAIGVDPNTTTTELAAGFSLSWRALMISPLFHVGRDIHLTNGEYVGEVLCNMTGATNGTVPAPKCSGSPPSPTTQQFWRGAFAIGLSVRVPTTFGGSSSSGH
jgi:hypothetical protein